MRSWGGRMPDIQELRKQDVATMRLALATLEALDGMLKMHGWVRGGGTWEAACRCAVCVKARDGRDSLQERLLEE